MAAIPNKLTEHQAFPWLRSADPTLVKNSESLKFPALLQPDDPQPLQPDDPQTVQPDDGSHSAKCCSCAIL